MSELPTLDQSTIEEIFANEVKLPGTLFAKEIILKDFESYRTFAINFLDFTDRGFPDVNFPRGFEKFLDELTPLPPKSLYAYIELRREWGKIAEKFPKTPEKAHRECLG